jgi:hypothetical protein
MGAAIGP